MKIAFFDFDGTITTKDTLFEVIKFQKGKAGFYRGLLVNAPVLAALKLKLVSNQFAKEKVLRYFFKGRDISLFQEACDLFADEVLPTIVRQGAAAEINKLKASGFEIVVVSASAENWIKKWSDNIGVQLIATRLETNDKLLTGKIKGQNCNGDEKAVRIKSAYDLSQYDEVYCYGDTSGDKPMLALATKAFYKPFR
jgi:HAD superfamily hydrolase (TIGR01490 family)